MSNIGSGIAGSIAATPLTSKERLAREQSTQAERVAKARELRKLAEAHETEVETTEEAELDAIRPDERRHKRRDRPDGHEDEDQPQDQDEPTDEVELESTDTDEPDGTEVDAAATSPPAEDDLPPRPGSILDVEA